MNIILEDYAEIRQALLPLTFTRPVAMLPAGIGSIASRWAMLLPQASISFLTEDYLQCKFPLNEADNSLYVPGHIIPSPELARRVAALTPGQWLVTSGGEKISRGKELNPEPEATVEVSAYRSLPDIFRMSKERIRADFDLLTAGRNSQPLPASCTLIGPADRLFIEEGADVEGAFINTRQGPVYIGRNSEVQECVVLRGPVAIGPSCRVRAGARLLPGVNLGESTRVGGEISNTVFIGYANKQHDGFLGDAVIGQWCNLGAGCVASNLKNDYSEIRLWSYARQHFLRTGLQFCGLIMADHCKAGINTMFNTATVVGPGCNIHGAGFPRPYVPAFSDGGAQGISRVIFSKFMATATEMMRHRGVVISEADKSILKYLYDNA